MILLIRQEKQNIPAENKIKGTAVKNDILHAIKYNNHILCSMLDKTTISSIITHARKLSRGIRSKEETP